MKQNTNDNLSNHPYAEDENTPLWNAVNKALSDLEQNQDIKLLTPREYVIGYICKQIKGCLKNDPV